MEILTPEDCVRRWEATGLLFSKRTFLHKQVLAEKLQKEADKIVDEKTYADFELTLMKMRDEGWFNEE